MGRSRFLLSVILAAALGTLALAEEHTSELSAGKAIYFQTCVVCHGADGRGAMPDMPNFTLPEGVLARDDKILLDHILNGFERPGALMAMPAKGGNDDLTIAGIRNVLAYLHEHFHYGTYDVERRVEELAAGKAVYHQTCVACHGVDGQGEIPGTPDLTLAEGVLARDDKILLDHILNGFESPGGLMPMPAKGANDALTIADIRNVLAYMHEHFHYGTYD
jgi:cbb3-type cytochrome c oxidase subunit III